MEKKLIGNSLLESVKSSGIDGITTEYLESGLDSLLDTGVLKDIPIVGTIISIYKTGYAVKDWSFIRKITRFLFELKKIPQQEREEFLSDLNKDSKLSNRVGEKLILIIEKLDDIEKADMLGKLFSALIMGKIDSDTFFRLSMYVDRVYINDLIAINNNKKCNSIVKESLANIGIMSMHSVQAGGFLGSRPGETAIVNNYYINDNGKLLLSILFD